MVRKKGLDKAASLSQEKGSGDTGKGGGITVSAGDTGERGGGGLRLVQGHSDPTGEVRAGGRAGGGSSWCGPLGPPAGPVSPLPGQSSPHISGCPHRTDARRLYERTLKWGPWLSEVAQHLAPGKGLAPYGW